MNPILRLILSTGIGTWRTHFSQLVGELGGVLEVTLMPTIAINQIPDSFYPAFAIFARQMNSKYGVPIILRFMHEVNGPIFNQQMNGYWMA